MTNKTTKHAGGRPTKYKSEYATREFIVDFKAWCKQTETLVSLCGYACYLEVCEDTLYEWAKIHPKFSESLAKLKQLSKQELINRGLTSQYSPNMAKFVLSANHGMAEKTEEIFKTIKLKLK